MKLGNGVHLTYCSNIHPGESWDEIRASVAVHVGAVRDRLGIDGDFGVGLRLSGRAAEELSQPGAMSAWRDLLRRERLYVFTVNGFPYGTFHGARVKEEVYQPDWRDPRRLHYTNLLADLLAAMLPEDDTVEGSISTVPGAFKPTVRDRTDVAAMVEQLLQHVAHLVALRQRTGRRIALALEPEPYCFLETIDEVIAFFGRELHSPVAADRLAEIAGLDRAVAALALREHLGVCLDLCHAAVEFEDPVACVERLRAADIRIPKMQISAGLRLTTLHRQALEALRRFDDPVYLHQVVQRGPAGLARFVDLPAAFASLRGDGQQELEWRVHFHVPIFLEELPPFRSTQRFVRDVLELHRRRTVTAHLEVETYTWSVLPEPFRNGSVDEAVARELAWVRTELGL